MYSVKKRLILLAALTIAVLLTACGSVRGGEDSAHPYSWREKRDGSVRLTIENVPEDGFSWQYEAPEDGSLQIERLDDGTKEKAVFSVTGEDAESGMVRFLCQRDSAPFDTSFLLSVSLSGTEKGGLAVTAAEYTQFPSAGSAGEEGKAACTWYQAEDGDCEIYLDSAGGVYDWTAMGYDSTLLSLDAPEYSEDGCTYRLTGLAAGETELLLYDLRQDYGFRFTVSVAEDLTAAVTGCKAGALTVGIEQIPGMADITALVGDLTIPDGFKVLRCKTASWYGGEEKDYAQLQLREDDKDWKLLVTKSYSVQELIRLCDASGAAQQTTVGGQAAVLCGTEEAQILFWKDSQGRSLVLYALTDGVAQEELLRTAKSLCAAQGEGA